MAQVHRASTLMQQLRQQAYATMQMPINRFFTPVPYFWELLRLWPGVSFVDCGCGDGSLIGESIKNGLRIKGCDIATRDGQDRRVTQMDATTLSWSAKRWPLICRPSHDGWTAEVIDAARRQGAHSLYVGLSRNFQQDIGCFAGARKSQLPVGEEGEWLYVIKPLRSRS